MYKIMKIDDFGVFPCPPRKLCDPSYVFKGFGKRDSKTAQTYQMCKIALLPFWCNKARFASTVRFCVDRPYVFKDSGSTCPCHQGFAHLREQECLVKFSQSPGG